MICVDLARLKADLEALGAIGRTPEGGVVRPSWSDADMAARRWLRARIEVEGMQVGDVDHLINSRDGQVDSYDINARWNFTADAPNIESFDPFLRLAGFLVARADLAAPVVA